MLMTLRYWHHLEQVWLLCWNSVRVFLRTHDILFNASKTKYMVFKRREIVHVNVAPLYFDGSPINCVHECDLLGITLSSNRSTDNVIEMSSKSIFNNGRYTTNIPTDPHTVTTTDIKTNMRHIHTSIVSRQLATRGNNKILRTPPPHTSSSEEILPRLTRCTLAQLRTNKSPFLKSYLHKVYAKTHPSPLCPLCNIHTHNTHHLFNCTHIRTTLSPLDLWTDPAGETALLARWTEKLAGGPQAETSDSPH